MILFPLFHVSSEIKFYQDNPHQSFTDIMGLSYKRIEIQFTFTF